ncbi:hypothetical protein DCAR_0417489 [Daucus carota subsp. sativus]|uniref:WRC domain-containing protein n=1 Tax=Daucus carota subsp. sativus TaxID=79200 RepID=A0AAF0X0T3_DAUCS|nr:hypothetical protein DCAR_0417489 [Daucus carota subsp. sativus]
MRIRKRLLLSSTLSPTTSDPQPKHLVQPTTSHELHPIRPITESQPSDPSNQPPHHPPNILGNTSHKFETKQKSFSLVWYVYINSGNKKSIQLLRLCVGCYDNAIAKGLDVEKSSQETPMLEKAKRMRSKTNKNCGATSVQQNDREQDKGNDDTNCTKHNMNVVKNTSKRGGVIMEGSRCSRVNGRGWRCCQQTLVGYSLCEHHLGKGRLRSMANVKGRAKMPTAASAAAPHKDTIDNTTNHNHPAKKVAVSSSGEDADDEDYNDEARKKPLVVKKKRMKLGVVKARSLSSLLNQTNNAVVVAADDN